MNHPAGSSNHEMVLGIVHCAGFDFDMNTKQHWHRALYMLDFEV
jgi:hypothetical protein